MKKNLYRRNKYNILTIIVYLFACFFLSYFNVFDASPKNEQYHLNLLTVNSVFLGFLFTGLGMMVGFADKKSVKSLNTAGYMDNYYNSIYLGLFFLIISTIVTIIGIVIGKEYVVPLLIYIQQITFVGGILFFIKSIFGLMKLIKYIRNDDL